MHGERVIMVFQHSKSLLETHDIACLIPPIEGRCAVKDGPERDKTQLLAQSLVIDRDHANPTVHKP